MRILLVSDAWLPQVNGVVRTLTNLQRELLRLGHEVSYLTCEGRKSFPMPGYREIRLAFVPPSRVGREIEAFAPDAIHLATEGPLGISARAYCLRTGLRFTTAFHTRYPEFVHAMYGLPGIKTPVYAALRWFHSRSAGIMVATSSMAAALAVAGFTNLRIWTRGVDHQLFRPQGKGALDLPRPVFLCAGRLAAEKGLEEFLSLDLPGSKVVIGGGPLLAPLKQRFPRAVFTGYLFNGDYARTLSAADVFVFAGRHETFGLVMLEALAAGVPVAAHPVPGPLDLIVDGLNGALDEDLAAAARRALNVDPEACRRTALDYSWTETARRFTGFLVPCRTNGTVSSEVVRGE